MLISTQNTTTQQSATKDSAPLAYNLITYLDENRSNPQAVLLRESLLREPFTNLETATDARFGFPQNLIALCRKEIKQNSTH